MVQSIYIICLGEKFNMTKTEKNEIIIIVLYFLSFLIFDLVSVGIMFEGNLSKMIGGNYNFF